MKMRMETENGVTALYLTTTSVERETIDKFMVAHGLHIGKMTEACGLISVDSAKFQCWKAEKRGVFADAIKEMGVVHAERIVDSLNDPIIKDGQIVNLAILRFVYPPDVPAKFIVKKGFLRPEEADRIIETCFGAVAGMFRAIFSCNVEVTIRPLVESPPTPPSEEAANPLLGLFGQHQQE